MPVKFSVKLLPNHYLLMAIKWLIVMKKKNGTKQELIMIDILLYLNSIEFV